MRQGRSTYIFPGSNTPLGFRSYYRQGLQGLANIFILKGGPGTGKSTLMRKIGLAMLERGYDVEFWQCSSDNDSLDGVVIKSISTAVIDGTAPHTMDPRYPGAVDEIINLGEHWSVQNLRRQKETIIELSDQISDIFTKAYQKLAEAGTIFSDEQTKNEAVLDKKKLQQEAVALINEIFTKKSPEPRHLFASAITPRGLISFTDALSRNYPLRYVLNGPPGSGKEVLMKALAATAEERGIKGEIYHNTLAPNQIEALLLPELGIAITDPDNSQQEKRNGDIVVDCAALLPPSDTAEQNNFKEQLTQITNEATALLSEAKSLHDKLEACYNQAMDYEAVDLTGKRLFNRILTIASEMDNL